MYLLSLYFNNNNLFSFSHSQVTHKTTKEVMVLKELTRFDEDAQKNFMKEVSILIFIHLEFLTSSACYLMSPFCKLHFVFTLISSIIYARFSLVHS